MKKEKKFEFVKTYSEKLKDASCIVFSDFRGLSVKEMEELRTGLYESGLEYKVVKNTLLKKIAKDIGWEGIDELIKGPTSITVSYDDPVVAPKVLSEYAKKMENIVIKGGILDNNPVSSKQIEAISKLPSKEVIYAQVLGVMSAVPSKFLSLLNAVPQKFVMLLNAIVEKRKEEGEE